MLTYLLWKLNKAKYKFYVVNNENIFWSGQQNFPNDSEKKEIDEENEGIFFYFTINFGPKTKVGKFI